ncbi:MAG: hypothetical protein AW12_02766 [Candidatus Accumulibacter sp. BA-94]|uniref:hypothetical protein n=1 Tax=Accumulibacter sp. TaxID=2053492 RepID=UPI00044E8045|nr:hypothetical protein [Accumulibacter sp.]EXI81656.1 MAG: hypothetical protein AW12_02766 [Candidatus Accumulibacter sp. BA-94]
MKSTEPLDRTGTSVDLSSATGEAANLGNTSAPDNKRRRLVRGAVAMAPLVLTLRSGALAAASCTGAKFVGTTTANGALRQAPPTLTEADTCFASPGICPGYPIFGPTKVTSVGANLGPVSNVNGAISCGNQSGVTVAILSSAAATSLMGHTP